MDADRKHAGLKALQGLIWHEAFTSGAIKGELFRDVPDALQEYRDAGIKTYIYSSGSRKAQADLFGHTTVRSWREFGAWLPHIEAYWSVRDQTTRERELLT